MGRHVIGISDAQRRALDDLSSALPVASLDDVRAMPLHAIATRGAARDFWDLHAMLLHRGVPLTRALDEFSRRYPTDDLGKCCAAWCTSGMPTRRRYLAGSMRCIGRRSDRTRALGSGAAILDAPQRGLRRREARASLRRGLVIAPCAKIVDESSE